MVFHRNFANFIFVLISSMGVHHRDVFISTLVYERYQRGTVELICLSVNPYLCQSVPLYLLMVVRVDFWQSFARPLIALIACSRSPQVWIPWVAIWYVRLSAFPYGSPRAFCDFFICINFQYGGPAPWCTYSSYWRHNIRNRFFVPLLRVPNLDWVKKWEICLFYFLYS